MTITAKYRAHLRNTQGCTFDSCNFSNLIALRAWARDRGGTYQLIIELRDGTEITYTVKKNRLITNK
jgi:hypothetical protein